MLMVVMIISFCFFGIYPDGGYDDKDYDISDYVDGDYNETY